MVVEAKKGLSLTKGCKINTFRGKKCLKVCASAFLDEHNAHPYGASADSPYRRGLRKFARKC